MRNTKRGKFKFSYGSQQLVFEASNNLINTYYLKTLYYCNSQAYRIIEGKV